MTHRSVSTKVFSAILSLLMATQVFPLAAMADSIVVDAGYGSLEAFPDYEPEVVYDIESDLTPEIPPDFTYLDESEYELIIIPEPEETDETESETDSTSNVGGEADFNAQPFIKNKKYLSEDSEEIVSVAGGSLEYSNTDYVLKGINGLDLVIGRRYKSTSSYEHRAEAGGVGIWSWIDLIPETYKERRYDIGKGWSFNFPSIKLGDKKENELDVLYLEDGLVYNIKVNSDETIELYNHYTNDFVIDLSSDYSNGVVSSKWVLKYKDGIRKYFSDDGSLIGIQNRYGDKINFVNSRRNNHPYTEITDTLGRLTVISGEDIEGGHIVRVNLPDNIELKYVVKDTEKSYDALTEYHDPEGNVIDYSYSIRSAIVTMGGLPPQSAKTSACLLSAITFPNGLQTVYSYYGIRVGSLSPTTFRVNCRYDKIGTSVYNTENYDYNENEDAWNYGAVTVTNSDGVVKTYSFDLKKRVDKIKTTYNEKTIKEEEFAYVNPPGKNYLDHDDFMKPKVLPTYISTKEYIYSNYKQTVVMCTYDEKNNVTAEWTAYADGDYLDTEHKTIYTYDDKYSILTSKTYKTDADTTVLITNTLDDEYKNILSTTVNVNGSPTQKTEYTYDLHGNIISTSCGYEDNFAEKAITEYTYDRGIFLLSETHKGMKDSDNSSISNITTSYTYDSIGNVLSTTDGNGNTTEYTYDKLGNVKTVTNPDDTTVIYDRDYEANTVTVTDENNYSVKYVYAPLGQELKSVDVASGQVMLEKEYDAKLRLISSADYKYGAETKFTYDESDRVTSETVYQDETILSETRYLYNIKTIDDENYTEVYKIELGEDNPPELTHNEKSIYTKEYYDKAENLAAKTFQSKVEQQYHNAVRYVTKEFTDTYTYDYLGRQTKFLSASDKEKSLDYTEKTEYNENGKPTKTFNSLGQYTQNVYDELGRLVTAYDYAGTPTTYTYDNLDRLLTQTSTIEDGVTSTIKYDYDGNGNIIRERHQTNAVGEAGEWTKTEYTYDSRNRLTEVKQYDGNTLASTTSYTYDGVGNMLTSTSGGKTTSYTYDRFGNAISVTDALGQSETYNYSTLGKLLSKTDRNGVTTSYSYDALGRTISVCASSGTITDVVRTTYTKTGRVHTEENNTQRTVYTYDIRGFVSTVTESETRRTETPSDPEPEPEPEPDPDPDPEPEPDPDPDPDPDPEIPVIPENSVTFTINYNCSSIQNEILILEIGTTFTLPSGSVRPGYELTSWTDENGNSYTPGQTLTVGEDSKTFTAEWQVKQYRISYVGNGYTTKDGTYIYSEYRNYDEEFKLTPNEFVNSDENTRFKGWSLTENSKKIDFTDEESVVNIADYETDSVSLYAVWETGTILDPIRPPVTEMSAEIPVEENLSYIKTYTYDLNGNRTGFTITHGGETVQSLTYEYDSLDRLISVKNGNVTEAEYTYDTNGNRASLTYANNTYVTYTYNKANWVTNLTNARGSYPVSSFDYTYYLSGNQKSKTDIDGKTTTYAYDDLNRLTYESDTSGLCLEYEYDSAGNRTSLTSTGSENYTTEYVYDDNNRLITETKSAGANGNVTSYTYDANGNTLTKSVIDGENGISGTTYEYNLIGQQTKSTTNGKSVCYSYNAQGTRTAKVTSNRYTSYYLDAANVAAEDVNGNVTSYIRGINLVSSISEGGTYYYTFNAHGDVVGLMNESNQLAKSYDYDAFGVEKNPSDEDSNPFRYCGEYYDVETGTYYLRARYYDPRIGRFTSEDKVNFVKNKLPNGNEVIDPLSLNLYVYCVNSPLLLCDLSGLSPELTQIVQGAVMIGIGALSVAAVIATGGAATPIVAMGYAAFASAGVVVAVQGASEITEAVTGNNPVKDFTGEKIYNNLTDVSLVVISNSSMFIEPDSPLYETATEENGINKPIQVHHVASNKNAQFTSRFEEITSKYGLDLNDSWNKVCMEHQGRHPIEYHSFILSKLQEYDRLANGDRDKFLELFDSLRNEVADNSAMLTKEYWSVK